MNPFHIVFAIAAVMLVVSTIGGIFAPSLGIATPTAPTAPTWPTYTDSTSWATQLVGFLSYSGGLLWFFGSFLGYMVTIDATFISFLTSGVLPLGVSDTIIVLVGIMFLGSLLMFIRGSSGGGTTK